LQTIRCRLPNIAGYDFSVQHNFCNTEWCKLNALLYNVSSHVLVTIWHRPWSWVWANW